MPRTMKGRASLLAAAALATPLAGCISLAAPDKPIEIQIKNDDVIELRKDPSSGATGLQIPMSQIGGAVKQAQDGDPQRPVVISADKAVRYETVVKAMNQLKASGIERVGLSVQTTGTK